MGQLVVERVRELRVIEAPDEAHLSLALLQATERAEVQIGIDTIRFGWPDQVEYEVVGWDAEVKALKLRKIV